jgi:Peptidase of plants and bacteria
MRISPSVPRIVAIWLFAIIPALAFADAGTVRVVVDVADVPELKEWADKAKALVVQWHPKIADMLKSDGFTPPSEVKLVFKKKARFIAYTGGRTITISANWIKKNPDDYGMVVHELTHVVQAYPPSKAGWLVEGIADYVRFYKYEPQTKLGPLDTRTASYRDGYRTTARFLAWVERTHDRALVNKLNRALRRGEYRDALFRDYTGKSLDDLWADFVKAQKK